MHFGHGGPPLGINPGVPSHDARILGLCSAIPTLPEPPRWKHVEPADHRRTRRWFPLVPAAGFDDGRWGQGQVQFVPLGGRRLVGLKRQRLWPVDVSVEDPDIAQVRSVDGAWEIVGRAEGRTWLHATTRRGACHRLELRVRAPVTLTLLFHRVRDVRQPDFSHHLDRQLDALTAGANAIIAPQTGVHFTLHPSRPVFDTDPFTKQPLDLGRDGLNTRTGSNPFLRRCIDFPNVLNVFMVREIVGTMSDRTGGEVMGRATFIGPAIGRGAVAARCFAHELGHQLGDHAPPGLYDEAGHRDSPDALMSPTAAGTQLLQEEANMMVAEAKAVLTAKH